MKENRLPKPTPKNIHSSIHPKMGLLGPKPEPKDIVNTHPLHVISAGLRSTVVFKVSANSVA